MTRQPLVSVMILGWNNYSDVIRCLKSVQNVKYDNYNVVIVDNGSSQSNLKKLFSWFDKSKTKHEVFDGNFENVKKPASSAKKIFVIKSDHNLGFTGGSNLGLSFTWNICDPEYLLLLNGDTLVTEDFMSELVAVCQGDKNIGSAQSALIRFDKKTIDSLGIEMRGYKIFDSGAGEDKSLLSDKANLEEIFGSCGASALYRADLIRKIGLFDEGLFATFEDFDLAWRIRLSGFKSVLVKSSITYHRGGVSRFRKDHVIFDMRSYLGAKNSLVVFNRYYPVSLGIIATSLVRLGLGFISALRNHRTREFISILASFPRERRSVLKNPQLRTIQRQWIK